MMGEDYKQTMIYALRQDRSALDKKVHDRDAEIRELQDQIKRLKSNQREVTS